MKRKLIKVALPLDAINKAAAREKSILQDFPAMLGECTTRKPRGAGGARWLQMT